jgi:hypothetical protein
MHKASIETVFSGHILVTKGLKKYDTDSYRMRRSLDKLPHVAGHIDKLRYRITQDEMALIKLRIKRPQVRILSGVPKEPPSNDKIRLMVVLIFVV